MKFLERKKLEEIMTNYVEKDENKKLKIYNGIVSKLKEMNVNAGEFLEIMESCSDILKKGEHSTINNLYKELYEKYFELEETHKKTEKENQELKEELRKVYKLKKDLSDFLKDSK